PIRDVFKLAVRTLPYVKSARRDLLRLLCVFGPIALLMIPLGMLVADLFFNRMLLGQPLTEAEALIFGLDPAAWVEVEALSSDARRALRGELVTWAVVLTLISTPIALGLTFYLLKLVQRINQTLRVQMVERVQAMSIRHHSNARVGDSIYHAYQDSAMITNLMGMLVRPIGPLWRAAWMLLFVWIFDWRLTLSLALLYLVSVALGRFYGPRLRHGFRRARELNSALTSRIQETLSGIKVVKAFGAETEMQQRFELTSREAFAGAYGARTRLALYGILSFCLTAIPIMLANCLLAVYAAEEKGIAAGAALAFTGFATWNLGAWTYANARVEGAVNAVRGLLGLWGVTQDMTVGMERAFSQVDLEPEVKDAEDAEPLEGLEREVRFEGVTFGYRPDRPVLRDVDFTAKAGEITALVGPTGSGKSTLFSLLLRLFDPDQGRISIDGRDIRKITLDSLRDRISIALQENWLFGTTIRENIRYARPEASDEEVRAAARVACADAFITNHAEGYDTALGERGTKLSTGQRQRLSIARAIIKDAPVLVLDEPTASLDAETELRLLRNLGEWGRGRAIFLITHRLSTIRQADRIVYLREGRVVEQGSHDELMRREDGAYRRFVELEQGRAHVDPVLELAP
ncbi:MAG: ABC transporter ATP-binding protein, partial [Deltaproteobacteria bacterium]|nr:ABC transporter ATP-binding protein [Deltaproteobacteria bacterium]